MKETALIMGAVLMILCGSAASTIDQWKTNDDLRAKASGGEALTVYGDVTGNLSIDQSGARKVYDAKFAASDVKDVSMTSSTILILFDEDDKKYTTSMEISNQLTLPTESNVVMNHDGEIRVNASDLTKPKAQWWKSLEFPDDLDLNSLGLGSYLEMSEQNLETLSTYCEDHGIGYSTGCNMHFSESNDELGISCRWGEGERFSIGGN
jgi:hypothetical protein